MNTRNVRTPVLDCEAVVRALWDYLDGRCEPERRRLIAEHLALCESCRSHAEFEQALLVRLGELGRERGDEEELRRRVMRAIQEAARAQG